MQSGSTLSKPKGDVDYTALRAAVEGAAQKLKSHVEGPEQDDTLFDFSDAHANIIAGTRQGDGVLSDRHNLDGSKPTLYASRGGGDAMWTSDTQSVFAYLGDPYSGLDTIYNLKSGRDYFAALDLTGDKPRVLPGTVREEGEGFSGQANEWIYNWDAESGAYRVDCDLDGDRTRDYTAYAATSAMVAPIKLDVSYFLFGEA